ncbi:MAG TPA: cupredoxin domain-containing protein [Candidatus Saccharimonadales bacterium]|nr:cupredoxin domain-containing protein [Candidatus Saccharimonadales bacterium]
MNNEQNQPMTSPTAASPAPPTSSMAANSKKMMVYVAALIGIAIFASVVAVIYQNQTKKPATTNTNAVLPAPAAISITSTGFVPASIQVKSGTTIIWTNTDKKPHRVATDPFPTNNGLLGFDSKQDLKTKETYSFTFDTAGTFTYHDDLNPYKIKGTIVVK